MDLNNVFKQYDLNNVFKQYESVDELELDVEDKCNDIVELRNEVQAVKLEAQQCRMRLNALEKIPVSSLSLPQAGISREQQQRVCNLKYFFEWLAKHVDFDSPVRCVQMTVDVIVDERTLQLRRFRQWPMPSAPGGNMSFSIPESHAESISDAVRTARGAGNVVEIAVAEQLAAEWDLLPRIQQTDEQPEPVVILAHRSADEGCFVSSWLSQCAYQGSESTQLVIGDRVEVEYEGKWFPGCIVDMTSDGFVDIHCDVDPPQLITRTNPAMVRKFVEHYDQFAN